MGEKIQTFLSVLGWTELDPSPIAVKINSFVSFVTTFMCRVR